jgi:hypothetical protein
VEKHIPSKILLLEEGKKKEAQVWRESCSMMVLGFSPQTWSFRRLVLPDVRRFWATFPRQLMYHKDLSSSCARGMSNPITHITRILLATERMRRKKKREKQKLAPYKIYSLCHSKI